MLTVEATVQIEISTLMITSLASLAVQSTGGGQVTGAVVLGGWDSPKYLATRAPLDSRVQNIPKYLPDSPAEYIPKYLPDSPAENIPKYLPDSAAKSRPD